MPTLKRTIRIHIAILAAVVPLLMMADSIAAQTYDLVILNGRVMDPETRLSVAAEDFRRPFKTNRGEWP